MRGSEAIEAGIKRAQRGSAAGNTDAQMQRAVGQYIERTLGQTLREFQTVKEKVEILNADRGGKNDAAVRRKDLGRLQQVGTMKSEPVTSAPTSDDYNALRSDVQAIHLQLAAIGELLARLSR